MNFIQPYGQSTRACHGQSFSTSLIDVSTIDVDQSSFTLVELNLIKIFPSHNSNVFVDVEKGKWCVTTCSASASDVLTGSLESIHAMLTLAEFFAYQLWFHYFSAQWQEAQPKINSVLHQPRQSFNKRKVWDVNPPGNIIIIFVIHLHCRITVSMII